MSAVAQILRAAADRIERDGWTQHLSGLGPNGECCIMVAVGKEFDALDIKGRDERQAMWSRLRAALEHHVRPRRGLMAGWNDTPGRTAEEVIAALRGAAADVEGKCKLRGRQGNRRTRAERQAMGSTDRRRALGGGES